jgi:predicted amidohydrolase YtcJ
VALDAVEAARGRLGRELDCRVSLSHIEVLSQADAMRFRELGVVANFTPHWSGGYFQGAHQTTGPPRSDNLYRAMPIYEAGGTLSFSSDTTTYTEMTRANPFYGMQIGHNRQEVNGGGEASILVPITEKLDLDLLVEGYTLGGAIQLGLQDELGSIEVGKEADFVVLSEDLFSTDPYGIHKVEPIAVFLGARLIFGHLN